MLNFEEKGISLLELLVVLALVSLLSSLAYPRYMNYLLKAKRLEGRCALLDLANRMEQYALQNSSGYHGATLEKLGLSGKTERGYYKLNIKNADTNQYSILAIPTFKDTLCTQLSLNQLGEQSYQGKGSHTDCWGH